MANKSSRALSAISTHGHYRRRLGGAALGALALGTLPASARAQAADKGADTFPNKGIKIIVPFPPGD